MNFMPSPPIWPTLFWTRPTLNFNKFLLVFFSLFNCPLKNQLVTKTWIIVWYLISWFGDEFCYPAVYWASLGAILSICLDSCLWVASHMGEETISCCAHLWGRPIPSNVQQRKKPSSWNKLSSSFSCLGGGVGFLFPQPLEFPKSYNSRLQNCDYKGIFTPHPQTPLFIQSCAG
jgi:hypothetical protein